MLKENLETILDSKILTEDEKIKRINEYFAEQEKK